MMLLVSRVCFMWHYKQVLGGFWGVMLTFVVDAREDDVVGVTRLLHVARQKQGFGSDWQRPKEVLQSFAKLAGER